jgi:hypothetical protein
MRKRKVSTGKSKASDGKVGFRTKPELKTKWLKEAESKGMSLTAYIVDRMEQKTGLPKELASMFYHHIYTAGDLKMSPFAKLAAAALAGQTDKDFTLNLDVNDSVRLHIFLTNFLEQFFMEYPNYIPKLYHNGEPVSNEDLDKMGAKKVTIQLV